MKAKAQMIGQIFIYILAIILVAFILVYGYSAVNTFRERAEQVSYIKFRTDIESTVKSISSDYGSVKRAEFIVPAGYKEVCFVTSNPFPATFSTNYPIIKDSVESKVEKNVFLVKKVEEESFYVGKIKADSPAIQNGLCVRVKAGKIKIQLEGKGDHAIISEWE